MLISHRLGGLILVIVLGRHLYVTCMFTKEAKSVSLSKLHVSFYFGMAGHLSSGQAIACCCWEHACLVV